ncbi:beta-secretase 1-like isoform X2 [Choristoneura fumiferana]|uniref:beta-secretase 1-like isoform X2 n=1 Tax=Choristoneura fumiferana TaxID=7141 RepID=UPI003D15B633
MMRIIYCALLAFILHQALGDEYNLFGDAGQAYSVEVNIGHPPQKFYLLVDTGSTTLAVASHARQGGKSYFKANQSSSIQDSHKQVQAKYSQGMWIGQLATDFVQFPSLANVPAVRSNLALITESHKFFMNGSGWQGLLGLAYLPVGAWGENVVVDSWMDSVDRSLAVPKSFQLKLCGVKSTTNATHYGSFQMIDDQNPNRNSNRSYRTPVLRKRWYEVGVISVRALTDLVPINASLNNTNETIVEVKDFNDEMCLKLNEEKSIVDSGTTNIRLPEIVFGEIVGEIRNAARMTNVLISDEFWYHGENYMRVVTASTEVGAISEFCYKLGLEAGSETVLGYTAMEGLEVLFNRSAGWIGWQTSNCGSNARITGPYNASKSLVDTCQLRRPVSETAVSIKAAQWALCGVSIIAGGVLVYLLAPCVKALCKKPIRTQQISLSQTALFEQES